MPLPWHWRVDIARGIVPGASSIRKFGHNEDIDVAWEHIWDGGGVYPYPTAAAAVRVAAGGDAADTAAGDGARSVTIQGLDDDWNMATETVVTAGASASAYTTTSFFRVFRVNVASVGVYGAANTAAVTVESATATLAIIAAGNGQTTMALYTIPAGFVGYMTAIDLEMEADKIVTFRVMRRENADNVSAPMSSVRLVSEFSAQGEHICHEYSMLPARFPAKTDIICQAKKIGSGQAAVSVEFSIVLVADGQNY